MTEEVRDALGSLPPRDREILVARRILPVQATLRSLARRFGLSEKTVSLREGIAMDLLQDALARRGLDVPLGDPVTRERAGT